MKAVSPAASGPDPGPDPAVRSFQQALRSTGEGVPATAIGEHLRAIAAAHPKEFEIATTTPDTSISEPAGWPQRPMTRPFGPQLPRVPAEMEIPPASKPAAASPGAPATPPPDAKPAAIPANPTPPTDAKK